MTTTTPEEEFNAHMDVFATAAIQRLNRRLSDRFNKALVNIQNETGLEFDDNDFDRECFENPYALPITDEETSIAELHERLYAGFKCFASRSVYRPFEDTPDHMEEGLSILRHLKHIQTWKYVCAPAFIDDCEYLLKKAIEFYNEGNYAISLALLKHAIDDIPEIEDVFTKGVDAATAVQLTTHFDNKTSLEFDEEYPENSDALQVPQDETSAYILSTGLNMVLIFFKQGPESTYFEQIPDHIRHALEMLESLKESQTRKYGRTPAIINDCESRLQKAIESFNEGDYEISFALLKHAIEDVPTIEALIKKGLDATTSPEPS